MKRNAERLLVPDVSPSIYYYFRLFIINIFAYTNVLSFTMVKYVVTLKPNIHKTPHFSNITYSLRISHES